MILIYFCVVDAMAVYHFSHRPLMITIAIEVFIEANKRLDLDLGSFRLYFKLQNSILIKSLIRTLVEHSKVSSLRLFRIRKIISKPIKSWITSYSRYIKFWISIDLQIPPFDPDSTSVDLNRSLPEYRHKSIQPP